jgi:hypothetical protein
MRKATRKKDVGMHPFLRKIVSDTWGKRSTEALIHALGGNDWEKVIDKVGTLTYIVSLASGAAGLKRSQPDIRVLRASVNVMGEVIEREDLESHRLQLHNTVLAVQSLAAQLDERFLYLAATKAKSQLALGSICMSHFNAVYEAMPA